jgi:hypothetical protein
VERHLFSGDIALRLENDSESLLLRTVYPAGLALSRRKLPKWLDASPFLERRKNRNTETQEWRSDAPKLKGVLRTGWKRLPFPLGWLKPRYCTAVVAVDKELDRLVLAEHRTPEPVSSETVIRAVQQMNQEVAG